MIKTAGQLVGFAAMTFSVALCWKWEKRGILKYKFVSDILWVFHHLMIGTYTAAMTTSVAIVRELFFYRNGVRERSNKICSLVFIGCFTAAAVITWKGAYSILPAMSSVLATIGLGRKKVSAIKAFTLLASFGMLIYGIRFCSLATIANEILTEVSMIASLFLKHKGREPDYLGRAIE